MLWIKKVSQPLLFPLLFSCLCFPPAVLADDDVDEVVVVGHRSGSGGDTMPKGSPLLHNQRDADAGSDGLAAVKADEKKRCLLKAENAKVSCEAAYNQLNGICVAYFSYYATASVDKFLKKLEMEISPQLKMAISIGSGVYNVKSERYSCAGLTARAMQYCAAGAEKMKASCN